MNSALISFAYLLKTCVFEVDKIATFLIMNYILFFFVADFSSTSTDFIFGIATLL